MSGPAAAVANSLLSTFISTYAPFYVQLHTGNPGSAGTANIAGNNTRQAFGTASTPSGGSFSNTANITWSAVSTTETYTFFTLWTASSGGTFVGSGPVSQGGVTAGQDWTIPAGNLTATMPTA